MAWYSNFGENNIGRLDPATAKVTEYPIPTLKPGFPTGNLGLQFDQDGGIWVAAMNQGGIAKFDPKTEKFRTWTLPPEWNNDATQVNMVHPERSSVDGKIWLENHGYTMILRMDLASGAFEPFEPFKGAFEKGEVHNIYDVVPDSRNNAYFTDFEQGQIGRIDAKTGRSPSTRPRHPTRGRAAPGWTPTTASGLPNTESIAWACSTREPSAFRSGWRPRHGARPTMSSSTRTVTSGLDR